MAVKVVATREVLASLRGILQSAKSGEKSSGVVVRCRTAREALTLLPLLRPQFLLLDPEVPWHGEIEVLKEIRRQKLLTRIVVVVPRLDTPEALEIARMGPAAIIARDIPLGPLIQALQAGLPGENGSAEPAAVSKSTGMAAAPSNSLTRREIEVARLASKGLHDREIANALHVSERTVKGHLHSIYGKLTFRGRNNLIRYCIASGWT